jgi:hypothetical protein
MVAVEAQLHSFLNSAVNGGKWSLQKPFLNFIRRWVDPRTYAALWKTDTFDDASIV